MESKIGERRASYEAEIGQLAAKIWRHRQEIDDAESRMRLLMGATQETERSGPEIDTLQAILKAQAPAQESATPAAKAVAAAARTKKKKK